MSALLLFSFQLLIFRVTGQEAKVDLEIGCLVPGSCVEANVIRIIRDVPSAVDCLQECKSDSECNYFAHYSLNDDCILQKGCPKFNSTMCDQCVSGQKECTDMRCQLIGQCKDSKLLQFEQTPSVEDCTSLCQSTSACTWWSYNLLPGFCYIFEDCVDMNQDCNSCTTSHRLCDVTPEKAVPASSPSTRFSARLLEKLHEGPPPGGIEGPLQRRSPTV